LEGARGIAAASARRFRFDENLPDAIGHGGASALKGRQHDNLSGAAGAADEPKACNFNRRGPLLETAQELNRFLADVERRAYRIAQMALRSHEDAQDAVQDAMYQLAKRYAARPSAEWAPLFYRILQSRIRDIQRRRAVRNRVISFFGGQKGDGDDDLPDPVASAPDPTALEPAEQVAQAEAMVALEKALQALPGRQREAFVLRILEGLDVAETAQAMGCSEGSVKTHLSRAMHSLRDSLGEHWS
jgi:RNA polymerase sigma-70 factor (ECF subfamily)